MQLRVRRNFDVRITKLQHENQARMIARFIVGSEPWITLRRTYDESLEILTDPSRAVYLAMVADEITGFIIFQRSGAFEGYIQTVGVFPGWRNNGIGSKLLKFAEEQILKEVPKVFIWVSSFNSDARRLYERLGYTAVGELKNFIVAGHSEILLRKSIAPSAEFTNENAQERR